MIRGAGPLDIIAYLMDAAGRHQQFRLDPHIEVRLETREVRSAHHAIIFYECKTPPFHNRTFLNALVWKKLSETQYLWCSFPIASHPSVAPTDEAHAVRAEGTKCLRLTDMEDGTTKVQFACTLDMKGIFPTWFTNKIAIPTLQDLPYVLQEYFLQIRPIGECTAEDGRFLGHMLMNAALKAKKPQRAKIVATFISRTAMLREASLANLDILLKSIICKESYEDGLDRDVKTQDPEHVTSADAETIGDRITAIRHSHTVPAKAVAEALAKYAVLRAMAQRCEWFEPMLLVILLRQMAVLMVKTSVTPGGSSKFRRGMVAAYQWLTVCPCRASRSSNPDEEIAAASVASEAASKLNYTPPNVQS
jgi:hypothetical protein